MNLRKKARLNKLSDISADIAQIIFASVVIPFILDNFNITMILSGSIIAFGFWILSYYLAQ